MSNNTEIISMGEELEIYIVCPSCDVDLLLYINPTEYQIMKCDVDYKCIFCDTEFTSSVMKQLKRKIKLKRLCQNIKT